MNNKKKKPFYKRVWFWFLVYIVVSIVGTELSGGVDDSETGYVDSSDVIVNSNTEENSGSDLQQEEIAKSDITEELEIVQASNEEQQTNFSVYSINYLNQYIENYNIDFPKERYKSKIQKVLSDDSEMIAVEVTGSEPVRYSATVGTSDFYYVGKMKNNVPDGWGKIIRVVAVSESVYDGDYSVNINTTGWGVSEDEELVPLLVYVGEFEDGYYNGYGWKYADHFEINEKYKREIAFDYTRYSDSVSESVLINCNPIEYIGEFKKGLYNGDGVLISYGAREVYSYMTDEEQIANYGVVVTDEIEFYIGEFEKGELYGKAKHYLLGKLLYEGEYRNWLYHGKGTLYYVGTTQKQYEGEWEYDQFHGKGTLYNEDGSVKYKGKWRLGDYAN